MACTCLPKGHEVIVEHDQDFEVVFPSKHLYVQVKTRSKSLRESDIADTLENFDRLRLEHSSDKRRGAASFCIVSNVPPGQALLDKLLGKRWPGDVRLVWPESDVQGSPPLPTPWKDIAEGLRSCSERAASLPFTALSPEALVWKLAGHVQLAASGTTQYDTHTFVVAQLQGLFEQIVLQLQDFPLVPHEYRSFAHEPALASTERIRVIVGFSGAGKTTWASAAALHATVPTGYFDTADIPGPALAASLARELTARLVDARQGGVGQILLPGASGVETLRLLERYLEQERRTPVVVLDNAHRVSLDDLLVLLRGTSLLRFVLLGHPTRELDSLCSTLGIAERSNAPADRATSGV